MSEFSSRPCRPQFHPANAVRYAGWQPEATCVVGEHHYRPAVVIMEPEDECGICGCPSMFASRIVEPGLDCMVYECDACGSVRTVHRDEVIG